ncbi:hypothetical protein VitviT2T_014888 [Vitis vinifera]|uniref:Uncharacterized protein n=1 Tax=Vitis vinifera TaxID=29760 RepID=A0ABY9CL46_VITVI|nr:hypothetical protein VitviT2T_014888 [Vitis vinifera]
MKSSIHGDCDEDLYEVALRFRLLRQEGYTVPADVLNNFKNKEGKFKQNLREDIRGLMGLYEASQLSIGEDILEEAGNFSSLLLNACLQHLDRHQAAVVKNTLEHPHHKSWARWWKDLGLTEELKFARDQPLKWYMWPMAIIPDPRLSEQRIELTKPISLIYIIDDIFDVGGTLDELTLFTEAVNRWDLSAFKELPEYMKMCFKTLDDITNEISTKVHKEHKWNPVGSLRKAVIFKTFLYGFQWDYKCSTLNRSPIAAVGEFMQRISSRGKMVCFWAKAEEYLKNGAVSSGVHVVLVHLFFLLGHGITKENVDLVDDFPGIISSTATILRLWDDLGSAKDENQDGHDGSYVECYLKEHRGSSVENARQIVAHMISDMWKRLNKECLSPNPFSTSFTKGSLNIARMVPLMYSYDDQQCLPGLEEHMKSLLLENLPYRNAQKINE